MDKKLILELLNKAKMVYTKAINDRITLHEAGILKIHGGLCHFASFGMFEELNPSNESIIKGINKLIKKLMIPMYEQDKRFIAPIMRERSIFHPDDIFVIGAPYNVALPPRLELINKIIKHVEQL